MTEATNVQVIDTVLDATIFDSLKLDGWDKTEVAPTRAEIHADITEKTLSKPYYWQHVDRKDGPQWLCSTDIDELAKWMETVRATKPEEVGKLDLPFCEDPLTAVKDVWIKVVAPIAKAQPITDAKVR